MKGIEMDLVENIIGLYKSHVLNYGDSDNGDLSVKHILENDLVIKRQVEVFNIYKDYLQGKTRFLDWGCKHAVDSYLTRNHLSDLVEIHGCDVTEEKDGILYNYSKLKYSQLTHPYKLPYENSYFDVVIGSGVLEHVPFDYESLKELHRIIVDSGLLIVTFLPNNLSYTEFVGRTFRNGKSTHRRRYSIGEINKTLLHTGFVPIDYGYHQLMPSLASLSSSPDIQKLQFFRLLVSKIYNLNKYAEKLWPINNFSANIFVIAQKKLSM
jgi:ubiquinone/menaquinone biosynthesis C-methylase UbiE